ncbi:MAG TPA: hypothetical protein VIM38_12800 [Alphaproteobacteria bacterium]
MTNALPKDFAALEPFTEWALPCERDRHRKRIATDLHTVRTFYDAMFPRMNAIMDFLDKIPVDDFDRQPAEVKTLHRLALAFMEVSHPIDMNWRTTDVDDAFPSSRFEFLPPSSVR